MSQLSLAANSRTADGAYRPRIFTMPPALSIFLEPLKDARDFDLLLVGQKPVQVFPC
jgi:hypothetical protein